jgi:protein TonB
LVSDAISDSPVEVVSSPKQNAPEPVEEPSQTQKRPTTLPPNPSRPIPPPQLSAPPPPPSIQVPAITSLSQDSDTFLEQFQEAEEARRAEAEATARRLEEERAEEARRQALAAKKKAREAKERAAREQTLAAQRAREQKESQAARRQQRERQAPAGRIASIPSVSRRSTPRYPSSAKSAGHEGTTRIVATITASGQVSNPRISTSSGYRALDSSALAAVKRWRFKPARNGLGQAVSHQLTIPVTFRIQ